MYLVLTSDFSLVLPLFFVLPEIRTVAAVEWLLNSQATILEPSVIRALNEWDHCVVEFPIEVQC